MKQPAIAALIVAFLVGSTPHALCVARRAFSEIGVELPKCPHCRKSQQRRPPSDPPSREDGSAPCCQGVDAVMADPSGAAASQPRINCVFDVPLPSLTALPAVIGDPCGDVSALVDSSLTSPRSGRALTLLLGHLLF
jgi:hypothetical protein